MCGPTDFVGFVVSLKGSELESLATVTEKPDFLPTIPITNQRIKRIARKQKSLTSSLGHWVDTYDVVQPHLLTRASPEHAQGNAPATSLAAVISGAPFTIPYLEFRLGEVDFFYCIFDITSVHSEDLEVVV
ncbi:hypothetical protein H2248_000269 [Termitomyces sp. 'cryptogamus']|nr:hypothetical protein H2248_000269 [Termitomyces sp. 'cryptogamus']